MSATSSLTKSCFAFKPAKRRAPATKAAADQRCFAACADRDGVDSAAARSDEFRRTWRVAQQLSAEFENDMFDAVFKDMIAFLQRSVDAGEDTVIPTAALITGVNMPDHDSVFGSLAARLRTQVSRRVAVLDAAACTSVQAAVRSMVRQLVSGGESSVPDVELLDDDEDEELEAEPERGLHVRAAAATMPDLVAHCRAVQTEGRPPATTNGQFPHKRSRTEPTRQALVVVWRDLEAFRPNVLQDLVLICSQYRHVLPISFVFGVSTCASAVHRLLPQHVSARLSLRKFHSQLATNYLTHVIDKVVLSPSMPFRLGGRSLRLLLDIFLYHDFSVTNFLSAYKYCMLQHFLWTPSSVLCCRREDVAGAVSALSVQQLTGLRQLPSVRTCLSERASRQQPCLEDDGRFRTWLEQAVLDLHAKHDTLLVALRSLFALTSLMPGSPLGKQFRELYNLALLHRLGEREEYVLCIKLLGMLSRDELAASLEAALLVARDVSPESELTSCLEEHLRNVRALDMRPVAHNSESLGQQRLGVEKHLKQATSRQSLRESLQSMGAAQSRLQNPYEHLRSTLVADLDTRLRAMVTQPTSWPLHEAVLFDSVSEVRRQLVGTPRSSLQSALSNPSRYLQCSCCKLTESGSIKATMPDLCIVYKLHVECGRLINMFDWMQAFGAVVNDGDGDGDGDTLQARFARAVAELQYLGFVKSTQKKTDHVARLTWGSC